MILELDIGNSRLKWRINGTSRRGISEYTTSQELPVAMAGILVQSGGDKILEIKAASVADDAINQALQDWATQEKLAIRFARTSATCALVTCSYARPELLGVDRWLAMVAAYNQVKTAVCVIDSGTALTLDFVAAGGQHQGGLIMPGLRPLQDAVATHMSKVPFEPGLPERLVLGDSTQSAVVNGTGFMLLGSLEAAINQQIDVEGAEPEIFVTGGDAEFIASFLSRPSIFTADLVLDGLKYVLP